MKILFGCTALALFAAPVMGVADNGGYPVGSYQQTCNNIAVEDNRLSASCASYSGTMKKTALVNLDRCLSAINRYGDIANVDGNLVCMPDLPPTDSRSRFPESETTINQWVYGGNEEKIHQHAWGIWAGLTSQVAMVDGMPVRAFETWSTPNDMLYKMETGAALKAESKPQQDLQLDLALPHQFRNMKALKGNLENVFKQQASGVGDTGILVAVAYNPPAADHAVSNKLFFKSTLDNYLKMGYTDIPNFPSNAITIKPVYKVISQDKVDEGIYTFPGWPGTPSPAKTFPESSWGSCVYVNVQGSGQGGNRIDQGCQGRTAANTFFLNNFIHHRVNAENADFLKATVNSNIAEGDYIILVGMHVTSRETKRWTWQTFWWSASPDSPQLPSSTAIAAQRPSNSLDAAANHYAMSVAYQMVAPAQPITGGKSVGESVIGYNPHLEAGFDPGVFQIIRKINNSTENRYGVETNCMTCHNLASYNPKTDYSNGANREKPYGTDYYMSLDDETFDDILRLDFAWSILGNLQLDK
jgi:hypothetical protein